MRVVVEAELNARRELDPMICLMYAFTSAAESFRLAAEAMRSFKIEMQ